MHVRLVMLAALGAVFAVDAETFNVPDFVWENGDKDRRLVESVPLKGLRPGMKAELEMWVDASNLTNSMPEAFTASQSISPWWEDTSMPERDKNPSSS